MKLEILCKKINFTVLKYAEEDFIQDGIIYIFMELIYRFDEKKDVRFSTFLETALNNFRLNFIRDNKRREILIQFIDDDGIDRDLNLLRERKKHSYYDEDIGTKIIVKEYMQDLYATLTKKEKMILKELYLNRYDNDRHDSKILLAYRCGIKYKMLNHIMNNVERKFKREVLRNQYG